MGMNFDIFSADASTQARNANNAANANLDVNLIIAQMVTMNKQAIDEMRNWEAGRFNNLVDGFHKLYARFDAQDREIQELKAQIAGLQKRLYEEEQKKTPLKAVR